ncbi:F-box/kelch-repeat protein [Senna tora]|uniref:F-box/kelch-repeat protein n=1 Tax=Senna tora TaxID=362788 RepID=A0A834WLK0_9FABA|nr:F-box/kelch-repeat protein [Senna tora]
MHSKFTRLTLYNETTGIPFRVYDFSGGHKKLSGVVGFSNGVVCLYEHVRLSGVYRMSFYFWNPLFNKFVRHECLESLLSSRCVGFGYDALRNDFKLVHVSDENNQLLARVYRISGISKVESWTLLWEITLRDDPGISEEGPFEVEGWKNKGEDAWVVDGYSRQVSLLNFKTLEFSDHQIFPKADALIRGSYSESLALMDGEDGQG